MTALDGGVSLCHKGRKRCVFCSLFVWALSELTRPVGDFLHSKNNIRIFARILRKNARCDTIPEPFGGSSTSNFYSPSGDQFPERPTHTNATQQAPHAQHVASRSEVREGVTQSAVGAPYAWTGMETGRQLMGSTLWRLF